MKNKLILAVSVLFLLVMGTQSIFAAKYANSIPKMDKKGITYFTRDDFDKKYKDNIRFVSRTDDRVIFNVYAFNEKTQTWFLYGTANIKFYDDTCFLEDSKKGLKVKNYNYFAIEPTNSTQYSYSYDVRHNDIYITVKDKR